MWLNHLVVNVPGSIYSCSLRHFLVLVQATVPGAGKFMEKQPKPCCALGDWHHPTGTELGLEKHPSDSVASFPDRCYFWPPYSKLLESGDLWASSMIYSIWSLFWWLARTWTLDCFWSLGLAVLSWHTSRAEFSKSCSSGQYNFLNYWQMWSSFAPYPWFASIHFPVTEIPH